MKQQTLNLLEANEHNPTYCSICCHEVKRHTPIGCDHVIAATRRYGIKNIVSVDFCNCSLTFEEVLK